LRKTEGRGTSGAGKGLAIIQVPDGHYAAPYGREPPVPPVRSSILRKKPG